MLRIVKKEKHTITVMVKMYCSNFHHSKTVCNECKELLEYAYHKIDKCVYGASKPTCSKCTIHCYKPEKKQEIIKVMRYAGPLMSKRHPFLSFFHRIRKKLINK